MANEQNLKPIRTLSNEEAKKRGRKGGIASGEAKRQRKALKESMELLLSMPIAERKRFNKAAKYGFDMEDMDNSTLTIIALYEKVLSGDVQAFKEMRSLIGEEGSDTGMIEALIRGLKE